MSGHVEHVTVSTGPKRNSEFCFSLTGSVSMAAHASENNAEKQNSFFLQPVINAYCIRYNCEGPQ